MNLNNKWLLNRLWWRALPARMCATRSCVEWGQTDTKYKEFWEEICLPRTKRSVRILARLSGWSQERSSGRKRRRMMVPNHGAHFCALPLRTERRRPRLVWATLITDSLEKPTAGWLCVRRRDGVRVHSVRISRVQLAQPSLRNDLLLLLLLRSVADRRQRGGAVCRQMIRARCSPHWCSAILGLSRAPAHSLS